MIKSINILVLIVLVIVNGITSCVINQDSIPILFGKDQCEFCKMTISNPKFGAELITDKGRILKYDALECMVNHLKEEAPPYQKLFAIPYDLPKELKPVDELYFLISIDFRSPMGANLAAFSKKTFLEEKYHSQLMNWNDLLHSSK
ncbi:hypothetical protein ACFCT7_11980 [Fulvivirgaceae bacterium LMO-SS25]